MMHQMLGSSLIKQALQTESEEYFNQLYQYEGKANKRTKNFCFAIRVVNYELKKEVFEVKDKVIMVISSPDQELMIRLYNGLLNCKVFNYKTYELNIKKVYVKQHKELKRMPVILKTQSPIWIKDNQNQSMDLENPHYQVELNYICNEVLKGYRGQGLQGDLFLEPIDMKKKVVKQAIREFSQKTEKAIYYTNCYEGIFKLSGELKDINDLVQLGIGFRRAQGYGLVEVL